MTRTPPMLGEQPGLFPEPHRVQVEPKPPRWIVLEPEDDEDEDLDAEDETLIAVDEGDDLERLRENYEDHDAYLQDNLTGRLYDPHDWPESDSVDHAALHILNTLAANDYLAALADYQGRYGLTPVAS